MSLNTQIGNLITRLATEFNAVRTTEGALTSLTTTDKSSFVNAINELVAAVEAAAQNGGAAIDDAHTATSTTWSSSKINDDITTALANLVNGAPGALDQLNELAAALGNDADFANTVNNGLAQRLRLDQAVTYTTQQKAQGIANLGTVAASDIGDTTTDFVALFNSALA